ncbi:MAG TPA: hypothetical protein VF725_04595 [Ktedonobacterales bacterium]
MARRGKGAPARAGAPPAKTPAKTPARRDNQAPTTLITVALALLLTLVGLAGYGAALLLRETLAPQPPAIAASAASLSAYVCDALKHKDYQGLVAVIDPATVSPTVTDAFDPAATVAALRAEDARAGVVVACAVAPYPPGSVVSSPSVTHLRLTLRRAHGAASTTTLTLAQTSGQRGWLIERDSGFLMALAIPTPTS